MSILGLALSLGLLAIVLIYIFSPLLNSNLRSVAAFQNKQRERAITYYERVLTNIRDLDDDLATGKIAEHEYRAERERWVERGVQVLKLIDQLDADQSIIADRKANDAAIDAAIEDSIRNAKREARQPTP